MTTEYAKSRPTHVVYMVEGDKDKAFWTKVGSAWQHEKGDGLNIVLSAIPLTGRLVIRKWEPKDHNEGKGA